MLISDDATRFALDKGEITMLTSMMADANTRPTLAAVWLYPAKGQAWATDGHRAVLADHPNPAAAGDKGRPVAIPATTAAHAAKTAGNRDVVVIDVSRDRVAIEVRAPKLRGTTIETFDDIDSKTKVKHASTCTRHIGGPGAAAIEGCFPSYQRRGAAGAVVAVNPALLRSVVMLAKVADLNFVWMNIGKKPMDPIFVVAHGRQDTTWRVVVMPFNPKGAPPPIVAGTDATKSTAAPRATRGKRGARTRRGGESRAAT